MHVTVLSGESAIFCCWRLRTAIASFSAGVSGSPQAATSSHAGVIPRLLLVMDFSFSRGSLPLCLHQLTDLRIDRVKLCSGTLIAVLTLRASPRDEKGRKNHKGEQLQELTR